MTGIKARITLEHRVVTRTTLHYNGPRNKVNNEILSVYIWNLATPNHKRALWETCLLLSIVVEKALRVVKTANYYHRFGLALLCNSLGDLF